MIINEDFYKIPMVSIGMPVFNDKSYLSQAIDSVLNQTFTDFELIISDDGSTDGSEAICKQYANNDTRICYIRQPQNLGVSRNMEFLLKQAKGKYFMWAGDDDILAPTFVETLIKLLDKNTDAVLAFCPTVFINEFNHPLNSIRTDYSGDTAFKRIKKLIYQFEDSCGYGLFIREKILNVNFPVWWIFNRKKAFNNIYPTLCFYLAKGNYVLSPGEPLFYKRREKKNVNHVAPFENSLIKGIIALVLWKFNLVWFSLQQIFKASRSSVLVIRISYLIFWKWFFVPSVKIIIDKLSISLKRNIN